MQVRPLSLPIYVPTQADHRAKLVDPALPAGDKSSRDGDGNNSVKPAASLPTVSEYEQGRQRYSYTRIEVARGRAAQALKLYIDVASGSERERIRDQLGLDIVV